MFIANFREIFRSAVYPPPQLHKAASQRVIGVLLPERLYKSHLLFFRDTKALVEKMERVLDDPEHSLCMYEGRELDFNLPSEEAFRNFVLIYNSHFQDFNPFSTQKADDKILLTGTQAKAFIDNRHFSADLYEALDTAIFQTQYMDLIRHLKNNGVAYSGPSIFQEIMNWQIRAIYLMKDEHKLIQDEELVRALVPHLSAPSSRQGIGERPTLEDRMERFLQPVTTL